MYCASQYMGTVAYLGIPLREANFVYVLVLRAIREGMIQLQ